MLFLMKYLKNLPIINLSKMTRYFLLVFSLVFVSCTEFGELTFVNDLPVALNEVSGIETTGDSDVIWMLNDSGNAPELYGLNRRGSVKKVLKIDAKNKDWEDLTADPSGNLYIGDFGNNENKRKKLRILKVPASSLNSTTPIQVEYIHFRYPNQTKFPPKKKKRHFDSESFFFYNDSLYIFTKSRVKNHFGKTNLYKIPAMPGNHEAQYINSFESCPEMECWITAADISKDGKQVALLNHKSVWLFSGFSGDDFFNGQATELPFMADLTQKEALCFKDAHTLYITDEYVLGSGGNLYEFKLTPADRPR